MAENTITTPAETNGALTQGDPQEATRTQEQFVSPTVDIFENEEGLTVVADLPGVNRESLDVQVHNDLLTIQGRTHHTEQGHSIYREFHLINFYRQFRLSDRVDTGKIAADLKHGVLTLKLPRSEEARPRKIEVQVN